MTSNKIRVIEALQALAINFGADLNPSLQKLWVRMLSGYSIEQIEAGIEKVISEYTYKTLPPFAVLKGAIEDCLNATFSELDLKIAAQVEWTALLQQIFDIGIYRTPKFLDSTTANVVRMMGGWASFCDMTEKEKPFKMRDFLQLWVTVRKNNLEAAALSGGADTVLRALKSSSSSTAIPASHQAIEA